MLAAVTPQRHAALREGMRRYATAFDWWSARGAAYDYTKYELCLRAGVPCEHLRPAALTGVWSASQAGCANERVILFERDGAGTVDAAGRRQKRQRRC